MKTVKKSQRRRQKHNDGRRNTKTWHQPPKLWSKYFMTILIVDLLPRYIFERGTLVSGTDFDVILRNWLFVRGIIWPPRNPSLST